MRLLRRLAYVALALAFAHIVFGAIVRITGSGLGCGDHWPKCNGHWLPSLDDPRTAIEITHRWLAALLGFPVIALAGAAWLRRREPDVGGRGGVLHAAALAAALVVVAALFGRAVVRLELTNKYVIVTHLAIAVSVLASLAMAAIRAGGFGAAALDADAAPPDDAARLAAARKGYRGAVAAAGLAFLAVVLGGLTAHIVGANGACVGFPHCRAIGTPGSPLYIHVAHRVIAFLLLFHTTGLALGVARRRQPRAVVLAARVGLGAVVLQILVAAALVEMQLPPALRSLHQAVGSFVWLSLFILAALARRAATCGRPAVRTGPVDVPAAPAVAAAEPNVGAGAAAAVLAAVAEAAGATEESEPASDAGELRLVEPAAERGHRVASTAAFVEAEDEVAGDEAEAEPWATPAPQLELSPELGFGARFEPSFDDAPAVELDETLAVADSMQNELRLGEEATAEPDVESAAPADHVREDEPVVEAAIVESAPTAEVLEGDVEVASAESTIAEVAAVEVVEAADADVAPEEAGVEAAVEESASLALAEQEPEPESSSLPLGAPPQIQDNVEALDDHHRSDAGRTESLHDVELVAAAATPAEVEADVASRVELAAEPEIAAPVLPDAAAADADAQVEAELSGELPDEQSITGARVELAEPAAATLAAEPDAACVDTEVPMNFAVAVADAEAVAAEAVAADASNEPALGGAPPEIQYDAAEPNDRHHSVAWRIELLPLAATLAPTASLSAPIDVPGAVAEPAAAPAPEVVLVGAGAPPESAAASLPAEPAEPAEPAVPPDVDPPPTRPTPARHRGTRPYTLAVLMARGAEL